MRDKLSAEFLRQARVEKFSKLLIELANKVYFNLTIKSKDVKQMKFVF